MVGARAIIRGQVEAVTSQTEAKDESVFTYSTIRVDEVLKGDISAARIVLKEEGGDTPTIGSRVYGTPRFDVGERVVVFLDTWPDGSLRVYQMFLGKLSINRDEASGKDLILRDRADAESSMLNPDALAKFQSAGSIETSTYLSRLKQSVSINAPRSREFRRRYYGSTPMLASPSEYKGAGDSAFAPRGSLLPIPARWFEPDDGRPITFYINPDGAPNQQVVDDVTAAINTWSAVPATSMLIVNAGGQVVCGGINGAASVVFNNCDGRFQAEPDCARIIARGGMVWDNRVTREINGQTFRKALRGFVSLNPYSSCSYGNHCDLREVVTHELGHSLGLGHSIYPEATMYGSIHFDGRCASLRTDDVRTLEFIYPLQDPGPKPLAITTSIVSDAIVGTHFVQVLEAEGGVMPYEWLHSDETRPPDGLIIDPSGALIGIPIDAGTFNFRMVVSDALGNTAVKDVQMRIAASSIELGSNFLSQSVPTSVQAGQSFTAVLRWVNTGTQAWDGHAGLRVTSQYPSNNTIWGIDQLTPTGSVVQPGQELDVQFTAQVPPQPGAYDFQWQLYQDGAGIFGQPSTSLTVLVYPSPPLSIDGPDTLQARVNSPVNYQFTVSGGIPPVSWSIQSGNLATGVTLSSSGLLSGTPTLAGNYTASIRATDVQSRTTTRTFTVTVSDSQLDITSGSLPDAAVGSAYTAQLTAAGGRGPYTWDVTSGSLPAGLNLSSSSGMISGTPQTPGVFGFTARATDADSRSASKSFSINITGAAPDLPQITSLKYKSGKRKLIVSGSRFDPQAQLLVDGVTIPATFASDTLTAKKLSLSSGQHQAVVMNPGGGSSSPRPFTVP